MPDVRVDIGLSHRIRQSQPGYPRALLGLDAVEHLVSRSNPASGAEIMVVSDIDGACTS